MDLVIHVLDGMASISDGSSIRDAIRGLLSIRSDTNKALAGTSLHPDGLKRLLERFEGAGYGHLARSWICNGVNHPVTSDQLHHVFGADQVQSMARQVGLPPEQLLSQLSQHLPSVVDRMTPMGTMPVIQLPAL